MKNITLSQCQLTVANTLLNNINITACDIRNALAADTCATLKILSNILQAEDLLGKTIRLNAQEIVLLNGVVTKVKQTEKKEGSCLSIMIHSILYPLKQNYHDRIFTEKNAREILSEVLAPYGFSIEFQLQATLYTSPLTTQYQQSDFQFLQSVIAQHGLFFYFKDEKLIIADHHPDEKPADLPYIKQASLQNTDSCIFELTNRLSLYPQTLTLQDYNPLMADLRLVSTEKDPQQTLGNWVYFDNQAVNPMMQKQLLYHERDRQQNQHACLHIKTNDMSLTLNRLTRFINPPLQRLNQAYRIVSIHHHFEEYYYNDCVLIPAYRCFRTTAPKKRFFGLQTATIYSDQATIPNLNEQGHYQIQMPYQKQAINAHLVRKLVQFTHPYQGQHFPLHDKTTVLLAYINGDINNPVILGSLTNDINPDVVTRKNSNQHIMRTHTQQTLLLDDSPTQPYLQLSNQQQKVSLHQNPNHLTLSSEDGNIELAAEGSLHYQVDNSFQQTTQGDSRTLIKHRYALQAENIHIETQQQSLNINIKQHTHFDAGHDLCQKTENQHVQTPQWIMQTTTFENQSLGAHESSAQVLKLEADTAIELHCGVSRLTIDAQGQLQLHSKTVEFHCKSLSNKAKKTKFDIHHG